MAQTEASDAPVAFKWPTLSLSATLLIVGSIQTSVYAMFHDAGQVPQFLLGIGIMGLGYGLSWRLLKDALPASWFWGVALASRLIFLPGAPGNDIWRYLWEGYIQLQGFSPYHLAPSAPELLAYRTDWWALINHIDVSAIYPPITQLGFRVLAALSQPAQGDVDFSVLLFKLAFAFADVAVCLLLWRRFKASAILYAWNPLVIYSFAGGGHYDSWLILPLVAAWLFPFHRGGASEDTPLKTSAIKALFIGISIGVKWISLPALGFLSWRILRQKAASPRRWGVAALIVLVGLLPVFFSALAYCDAQSCPLIPTGSTFVSRGRSAEFLPYLAGQVWPFTLESNRWFALPLGLLTLIFLARCRDLGQSMLNYFMGLMFLSPIIHAWYFTWMVPFAVGYRNWGAIWGSLSVFVYFVLPGREYAGSESWLLEPRERLALWVPFVAGCLWTAYRRRRHIASG